MLRRLSALHLPRRSLYLSLSKQRSRALWTATTDNHADLPIALANALKHIPTCSSADASFSTKNVAVILASRSYDGSQLLKLPSLVPASIRESTTILAAVVNRVPTKTGHGVSTMTWTPSPSSDSVAPFVLHGSEYKRKRLKEKSVGRWARQKDIEERELLDTADAWDSFKSISTSRNAVELPQALAQHVQTHHLHAIPSNDASPALLDQQVLVLSDPEVHQFLDALDDALPQARKAGMVVSSTPFITGEMHTMFYNDQLVRDGLIGLSIVSSSPSSSSTTQILPPPLEILSQPMVITRCRGNIILGLDAQDVNPTRALLGHLEGRNLQKTDEFYIATGPVKPDGQAIDLSAKETKLFKITGGDPSKGNMAVDTVHDLQNGQWVQFMTQNKKGTASTNRLLSQSSSPLAHCDAQAVFQVDDVMIEDVQDKPVEEHKTMHGLFGGSTENGIIIGLADDFTWVCPIPHVALSHTVQTLAKQA